jgi:integrase
VSVYKRSDGYGWEAVVWIKKRRIACESFARKADAVKWHDQVRARFLRGERLNSPSDDIAFADLTELWLDHVKAELRPKTYKEYRSRCKTALMPIFGAMMVSQITREAVERWRSARLQESKHASQVNHDLTYLRACLSFGIRTGRYVGANAVASFQKAPEPREKPHHFYQEEEVREWLEQLPPDGEEHGLLLLAFYQGLRPRELVSMRFEWVDWRLALLRIPNTREFSTKSHAPRDLPAHPDVLAWLRARERATGPVFWSERLGEPEPLKDLRTRTDGIRDVIEAIDRRAKRKTAHHFTLYDMRHSCASWLIQRGATLEQVRQYLGHKHQSTTEIYRHLAPDHLDALRSILSSAPRRRDEEESKTSKVRIQPA